MLLEAIRGGSLALVEEPCKLTPSANDLVLGVLTFDSPRNELFRLSGSVLLCSSSACFPRELPETFVVDLVLPGARILSLSIMVWIHCGLGFFLRYTKKYQHRTPTIAPMMSTAAMLSPMAAPDRFVVIEPGPEGPGSASSSSLHLPLIYFAYIS
ncbi:Hypothetical protein GLP15_4371 [Giardia lamblia P15]|uniref:Uncharacterized protein n=1 Tax=Giardia intestinalis (strain P15) TaxID=658858 RepID=E1F9J9_GIAIA|nr:Hypothetical protein GLP15_4371 [Giardia lamblia P15]